MPQECTLPELGENIESGTVVEVLVAVGDTVSLDQPIMVLETDKAEFELPSPVEGTIEDIRVSAGDEVKVGQVLLTVSGDGAKAPEKAAKTEKAAPAQPAARERAAPKPEEKPAPKRAAATRAPEPEERAEEAAPPATAAAAEKPGAPIPAAPSVRRLARELGVDLHAVAGSGEGGRITESDVRRYAHDLLTGVAAGAPAVMAEAGGVLESTTFGPIERVPMSKVRRRTAERMAASWTIPHVTQVDKADLTDMEALRKRYGRKAEASGAKLTVTAILAKIVASALRKFPQFNASIDLDTHEIVYKRYVHLGIAVDTERGLLVPVVRDVDRKNVLALAAEIQDLADKARNRNIRPDLMQGATFTITNLGGIGGTSFTPIINAPEVAILGVSRAALEPVYRDGAFEPRLLLPLSLSYDHRLIDGADAARFVRWICEAVEEPFLLALEGE